VIEPILFAHERPAISRAIEPVLRLRGYAMVAVADGDEAMVQLERRRFAALVTEVALPSVPGYELIGPAKALAASHAGCGAPVVLLVASVYRRTSYKRLPQRLYGADDYVEIHHLGDLLPDKLDRLLGGRPPPPRAFHAPSGLNSHHAPSGLNSHHAPSGLSSHHAPSGLSSHHAPSGMSSHHAPSGLSSHHAPSGLSSHHAPSGLNSDSSLEDAELMAAEVLRLEGDQRIDRGTDPRALAELIVADLILYNGDRIAAARSREGAREAVSEDLGVARAVFTQAMRGQITPDEDPIGEAFDVLMRSMGRGRQEA